MAATNPNSNHPQRERLRRIIADRSFAQGEFTLSSGATSSIYFDLKPTMLTPEGAALCARAFLDALEGLPSADYVGGLEMGAVPIIAAMAALSFERHRSIPCLFVRKETKGHGTKKRIEGLSIGESIAGKSVIVADDVTTSGSSVLQAVHAFRAEGADVSTAISLVDRGEGAEALLRREGVSLHSVFTVADFV